MTLEFLQMLFGEKDEALFIYIWTFPDRKSAYFRSLDEAAAYAAKRRNDADVYIGCSMTAHAFEPTQRIKISEGRKPAGIVALWADLDVMSPGHKKAGLPKDIETAKTILFPKFQPSLIVSTGGGIHCWWIFKEPWTFENDGDIERAAVLALRWNRALKNRAAMKGFTLDVVSDLSRVLRVPGTLNRKIPGEPRDVTILETCGDCRYNWSDCEEYLDLLGVQQVNYGEINAEEQGKLIYSINAEPPLDKLALYLESDELFRATYERKRKDFQDPSASSYDMALANFAVQAGWLDQEIVNLIIHWRRKHGEEIASKLRDTYFLPTIRKARAAFKHLDSVREIEHLVHMPPEAVAPVTVIDPETKQPMTLNGNGSNGNGHAPPVAPDPAQHKAKLCDALSDAFGLPPGKRIVRLTKYLMDPPEFRLHLEEGEIQVGESGQLISHATMTARIAAVGGHMIPFSKGEKWRAISQAMLNAAVPVDVGDEGTETGQLRNWLASYLEMQPPLENADDANGALLPFKVKDRVAICVSEFARFVHRHFGATMPPKNIARLLREIKAKHWQAPHKKLDGTGMTTRSVYLVRADGSHEAEESKHVN